MGSSSDGAIKFDEGKPRWDLAPMSEFEDIVKIMTFGASKYADNGWKGVDKDRYIAAMLRHITAYMSGEEVDEESGMSHLAHAACNVIFIMWKDKNDASIFQEATPTSSNTGVQD
jgi:hypothetical protein